MQEAKVGNDSETTSRNTGPEEDCVHPETELGPRPSETPQEDTPASIADQSPESTDPSQNSSPRATFVEGVGEPPAGTNIVAPGDAHTEVYAERRDEETKSPISEPEAVEPANDGADPTTIIQPSSETLQPKTKLLTEASNLTLATAKDVSASDYDVTGNKARLSKTDSGGSGAQSQKSGGQSHTKKSLFGKLSTRGQQDTRRSSPQGTEEVDVERGGGQGAMGFFSPSRQGVSGRPGSIGTGDEEILSDESRLRRRHREIIEEERNMSHRQCVICVVFIVLLFGGVGLSVGLQIRRTSA
ncbi:expressed unknown protein [Seminavis robusta]|uniref:Transmembrane protein n=1 Tax=Seminavis robusta TaxID=568900 RepID=A0A9N8H8X2_9STRA|nr:expressed unknown protein [Seminavis robusta]|eukprot:Sro184_g080040.1 n/a (300) ;mRNA; r:68718-69617